MNKYLLMPKVDTFTNCVRLVLKDMETLHNARAPQVASYLAVSQTSLGRNLRAEGTRFKKLVFEERRRRCAEYFDKYGATRPASELCQLCGYNQNQQFYRAFEKFYGEQYSRVVFRLRNRRLVLTGAVFVDADILAEGY